MASFQLSGLIISVRTTMLALCCLALTGCNNRQLKLLEAQFSSYFNTSDPVISCFAGNRPVMEIVSPAGNPAISEKVIWRVALPAGCNGQFRLERDGAEPVIFAQNAYFEKVYALVGRFAESVRVTHVNPVVVGGPAFAEVTQEITVAAGSPPPSPNTSASCELSTPVAKIQVVVDSNNMPLLPTRVPWVVKTNRPLNLKSIELFFEPASMSVTGVSPTGTASAFSIDSNINRLFQNLVIATVVDPADSSRVGICALTIDLEPVRASPLPSVSITADGLSGVVNTNQANVTVRWFSNHATSCAVEPTGWVDRQGEKVVPSGAVGQQITYTVSCVGPGGQASAWVRVNPTCDPTSNVLKQLVDQNTIARNLPRRLCQNGVCGSYPAGVFDNTPRGEDVIIKSQPLLSGLRAGQRISMSNFRGEILSRVRHDGSVEGWSVCDTGLANSGRSEPIAFQFTDDAGNLIAYGAYAYAMGAMIPSTVFKQSGGVIVPNGATQLWDSFPDSTYWDNEYSVSNPPRVPRSRPSTNGCRYNVTVLGCQ